LKFSSEVLYVKGLAYIVKRVSVLLFCVALISMVIIPAFAVSDTTPPEISSISIHTKSLFGGDTITFLISGNDDMSGIGHVMVEYRLKTDNNRKLTMEFDNNSSSNSFSATYKIPDKTAPGEWNAFAIQVWDGAGNLKPYLLSNTYDNDIIHFSNIDFIVKERPGVDITPPVLQSISVKNKVIAAPGKIEVTAVATDDKTQNVKIQVTYLIAENQNGFSLSKTSGNTYSGSLPVDENAKYQPVKLAFVLLEDDAGNQAWYSYNPNEYPFGDVSLKLNTNIDISFSNAVSDKNPPSLVNYTYSSSKVAAPGVVSIIFDAKDDISGVAAIKAHFIGVDENGSQIDYWILNPQYNTKTKKFVSEHVFDQYYPNSTFTITQIEVMDYAGNIKVYAVEPQSGETMLEKKVLTLTKAITGDVAAGTMNDDYIDKIKAAKDNDVITLDCTKNAKVKKEAFDAIKGTNKTLLLVNDGIQWIFKGADISETTKDINTQIKISKLDDFGDEVMLNCFVENNNGLVIEFAPNGILPCKALIKIKADYTFRDYVGERDLYVYHYQGTDGSLEAIANKIEISENGYYEFYITHNSKYIISSKKAKAASVVKDSTKLNEEFAVGTDVDANEAESYASQAEQTSSSETTSLSDATQASRKNNLFWTFVFIILLIALSIIVIIFRKPILSKISDIISRVSKK